MRTCTYGSTQIDTTDHNNVHCNIYTPGNSGTNLVVASVLYLVLVRFRRAHLIAKQLRSRHSSLKITRRSEPAMPWSFETKREKVGGNSPKREGCGSARNETNSLDVKIKDS